MQNVQHTLRLVATNGGGFSKSLREAMGTMSATELSRKTGLSQATISRALNDRTVQRRSTIAAIEKALGVELSSSPSHAKPEEGPIYVIAPMAQESDRYLKQFNSQITEILSSLTDSYFWAGASVTKRSDLALIPDFSAGPKFDAILASKAVLYVQFETVKRRTSSLFELGLALGSGKRTTMFIGDGVELPFILRGNISEVAGNFTSLGHLRLHRASPEQTIRILKQHSHELFD